MRKLLVPTALVALCQILARHTYARSHPPTDPYRPSILAQEPKKWSWQGSCQVICSDGSCKIVCGYGIVSGNTKLEAQFEAEKALSAEAGRKGVVVGGSIKVTVGGGF
jgi:hypothetical protein